MIDLNLRYFSGIFQANNRYMSLKRIKAGFFGLTATLTTGETEYFMDLMGWDSG